MHGAAFQHLATIESQEHHQDSTLSLSLTLSTHIHTYRLTRQHIRKSNMKKATIRFPCGRDVRVYVAPGLTVAGLLKQLDLPVHSHGLTLRKRAEPLPYETKLETTVRGSINDTHIFEVVHVRSEVSNALRATPLPFLSPCTASAKESIHAVS